MVSLTVPTVRQLLDTAAQKYGEKVFISFVRESIVEQRSYNTVRSDSEAICRWIRHFSEQRMHIALIGKTNYEYITCMTGILISGNVAVPFAPDISVQEAAALFKRADIDMLLYEDEFADKAKELAGLCPFIKRIENLGDCARFERIYSEYSEQSEYAHLSDIEVDENECAIIIFTSGTTGVRKGVMLSTKSIVSNIMHEEHSFSDKDIALSVLPMYHIFCFSGDYLMNLMKGVGICLNGDIREICSNLTLFEPVVMRVVPMIAQSLLHRVKAIAVGQKISEKDAARIVFGKNIKRIFSGGAYLSPTLVDEYGKLGIFLRQGYGMTEAGCRISVPDDNVSKDSVGRVINICDVRIVDGEIQVKTPSVMLGYYKMPDETAEMFTEDGWLRTGDIGYVTDDRQLFITGRVKNLIILSSGENVSPEAIEKKFSSCPLAKEVMVYGERDRIIAEAYPDYHYAQINGIMNVEQQLEQLVDKMNVGAKPSHVIAQLRVRSEPFEKTASGKIKRKCTNI